MDYIQLQQRVEELAAMHTELVALLDTMDIAMIFLDTDFTIKRFTPATSRLLTLTHADLGRPIAEVIKPGDDPDLPADAIRVRNTCDPVDRAIQVDPDRWYRRRILPYYAQNNHIAGLVVTFTEVPSATDTEIALRQSEARFRLAVDNFPYVFVIYDAERRIQFINASGIRTSGLPEQAILGRRDEEIFPPEVTDPYLPLLQRSVATRTHQQGECRIALPHKTFDITVNYVPLLDNQGEIQQILGITHDITERRRAEDALRESEARLRLLFEFSRDAIVVADDAGRYVDVNHAACELLGYRREELLCMSVSDLVVPDEYASVQQQFAEYRTGGSRSGEFAFVHPTGQVRITEYSAQQFSPGLHVSILRDITERRHAEEERRRFEAKLQQTQKLESLGVLAGGIAHDFNNLLMGIFGFADLALMDLAAEHPARENVEQILVSARRAADLTHQMLAYSGRGKFVIKSFELYRVVKDMAHLLEVSVAKRCALTYQLAADLPPIEGDVAQIHQILLNLTINASEAIGDHNGVITISTGMIECDRAYLADCFFAESLPAGTYVYIEVADTGSGITEEVRMKMFDPFFTTKFTGRGLGLAVVLGIVRGHKGTIKVVSTPGQGTIFRAHFPVAHQSVTITPTMPAGLPAWNRQGTILLADDEETVRTVAQRMLEMAGFQVLIARDGCEAVDMFTRHAGAIRAVLLDMTMPCKAVDEVLPAIRAIDTHVPVILTSGYNEQEAVNRFVGAGLAAFIHKPYRYETLLQTLRQALEPPTSE